MIVQFVIYTKETIWIRLSSISYHLHYILAQQPDNRSLHLPDLLCRSTSKVAEYGYICRKRRPIVKKHIPSLFTMANLCCGVLAILTADLRVSSLFIISGLVLDIFDGLSARLLNAQSELGKQLDSLSDLITFGVAPAYLYYLLAPGTDWFFYVAPVVLVMCSALRLGKFNTLPSSKDFIGLATPAAASFFLGLFFSMDHNNGQVEHMLENPLAYLFIPFMIGALMISNLPMFSLKGVGRSFVGNLPIIVLVSLTILLAVWDWRLAFSGFVVAYVFISIFVNFARR